MSLWTRQSRKVAAARRRCGSVKAYVEQVRGCATLAHRSIQTFLNVPMQKNPRAMIVSLLLVSGYAVAAIAADDPPESTGANVSEHLKAAAAAAKRDAKVVGSAVKEGAQKVGVEAKKVAHTVADSAKKGAHEVTTATKDVVAKSKAALKSDKADRSEKKPAQ